MWQILLVEPFRCLGIECGDKVPVRHLLIRFKPHNHPHHRVDVSDASIKVGHRYRLRCSCWLGCVRFDCLSIRRDAVFPFFISRNEVFYLIQISNVKERSEFLS